MNERQSIRREAAYAREHKSLPARVFLSVGSEQGPGALESFASTLRSREYQGLELTSHVFEGETHASVVAATLSRSLRALYPVASK